MCQPVSTPQWYTYLFMHQASAFQHPKLSMVTRQCHAQALTNEAEISFARNNIDMVMCSHKNLQKLWELSDRETYEFEAQQRTQGATMKWEIGADSGAARNIRDGVLGSRKIGLCHQSCTVLDGTVMDSSKEKKKWKKNHCEVFTGISSHISGSMLRRKALWHPTKAWCILRHVPPCPIDIAVMTTVTPAYWHTSCQQTL